MSELKEKNEDDVGSNPCGDGFNTAEMLESSTKAFNMEENTRQICEYPEGKQLINDSHIQQYETQTNIINIISASNDYDDVAYSKNLQQRSINVERREQDDSFIIPYICSKACNYISISVSSLNKHLKQTHSEDKKINCSICSDEFENCEHLFEHINKCHINSNKIIFKCQMENCFKLMYRLSDLKIHFSMEHQNLSSLCCTFCKKQKPIDKISLHIQHHLKNTFKCSYCDLSYEKKDSLFEHIKSCHIGLPKRMNLLVEIINYERLNFQMNIVSENSVKTNETCQYSEESVDTDDCFVIKPLKNSLNFQCSLCSYTDNTEKALNLHLTSCHLNVQVSSDYSCSLCSYATDDKESFREHIAHHKNVQHKIRMYACSYCKKQSTSMDVIEQHVSNKHPFDSFKFKAFQESISYSSGLVECFICKGSFLWKDRFCCHLSLNHKLEHLANYLLTEYHHLEIITENVIIPKSLYDHQIKSDEINIGINSGKQNKSLKEIGICIPKQMNKMLFSCKLCPFQCNKTMNFKRHSAIHEKAQLLNDCYKCAYCQFKHNKFSCIKFHLNKYHNELPIKILKVSNGEEAEISMMETNAQTNVDSVYKLHNDFDQLNRSSLIEFVDSFLPRGMIFPNPVKCPYCEFTNRVRVNFIRHMKFHINEKFSSDTDTGDTTNDDKAEETNFDDGTIISTNSDDDQSIHNSDMLIKNNSTKKLFKCAYCNMISKWNRRDICLHIIHVHLLKKVYSCSYCNYGSSKSSQQVLYHCNKAHADQPLLIKDELALFNSIVPLKDGDGVVPVAYVKENSEPILNLVELGKYLKIPVRRHKHDLTESNASTRSQNDVEPFKNHIHKEIVDTSDSINNDVDVKESVNGIYQNSDNDLSDFEKNLDNIVEWKCLLCGLQMFNESMMKRHVMCQHLKQKPFSCIYCTAHYWQKQTIENHIRHSHPNKELQYNESAKNQTINFTKYVLKMTNVNLLNNQDNIKKTLFSYHCQICGYQASRHDKAKYHVVKKHLKIGLYCCSLCRAYMSTKNCLDKHIRENHSNENAHVLRSYDTHALLLQKSIKKVHNPGHFKCATSLQITDEENLNNNNNNENSEAMQSMTCKHCGYFAKSKFAFNNHARVHRLHVCGYCGYKNRLINKVQLHCTLKHPKQRLLTHVIEDQVLSPKCENEMSNDDNPVENLQSFGDNYFENESFETSAESPDHSLPKRSTMYKCNLCEYGSDKITVIRHHVMSHLLYHPYQCPYCNMAKSVKSSPITKHVSMKHPKEILRFECIRDEEMEEKVKSSYEKVYYDNDGTCIFSTSNDTIMTKREEQMFAMNKRVYYKCCFCSLITPIRTDMKHHLMREIKYKPYSCCYCNYEEPSRSKMGKHFRIKHPGMDVSISDAIMPNIELELKTLLQQCMVRINQKQNFNGKFDTITDVKIDNIPIIKISHNKDTLTSTLHYRNDSHKCNLCKYGTFDVKKLISHKMKRHYSYRKCWYCQLHVSNILQLRRHVKKCRSKVFKNINKRCYYKVRRPSIHNFLKLNQEDITGKRLKNSSNGSIETRRSKNNLKRVTYDKNIIFCCNECDAKYHNVDQFSSHMQTVHFNLKITFPSIEILSDESQSVSTTIKQCGFCSFTCELDDEYQEHVNMHTKLKPIKCKHCLFASFTSSDMKRHFENNHPNQDVGFDTLSQSYTMNLPTAVTKKNTLHLQPIVKLVDIQFCLQ